MCLPRYFKIEAMLNGTISVNESNRALICLYFGDYFTALKDIPNYF